MNAVDTNVLVRLLVRDDERQAQRARRLLRAAERDEAPLRVTDTVVLELIWVLASAYSFTRGETLDALELIADLPALRLESHDLVRQLVAHGRRSGTGLADLFIGLAGRALGCETTYTFDRRLTRTELFGAVP